MEEKGANPAEIDELLARFQGGDESAFTLLCDRYLPMLSARVHSCFGYYYKDAELDISEMMQDARLALSRAAEAYDISNGKVSFGYYARACVNNALVSYCRLHKKRASVESIDQIDEILFAESGSPLDSLIAEEKLAELYRKISAALSPFEHRVFDLYIEGESTKSIAEKLGKAEKSVSNALGRTLKKLRAAL